MSMTPAPESKLMVLMFCDIVGSVALKSELSTSVYSRLLMRHDRIWRDAMAQTPGARVLQDLGDGYFLTFETPSDAVRAALAVQWAMGHEQWEAGPPRTRIGIHLGEMAQIPAEGSLVSGRVIGLAADVAARVMSLGQGGQILMTRAAFNDARQFLEAHPPVPAGEEAAGDSGGGAPPAVRWVAHGPYLCKGVEEPIEVFEVGVEGVAPLTPPGDSEKARRAVAADQEATLGWRPSVGSGVPGRPRWVLQRRLGAGGFGEVWLAGHAKLSQRRVFKFCFDAERLRSLKREMTFFRLIRDALGDRPDMARLHEVKLDRAPFYLESDYTEGGDLSEWASRQGGLARVPLETRLGIVADTARAVAAAHSVGVLHKDIKPSNILIAEDVDGRPRPRLADFGIGMLASPAEAGQRNITLTGFTQLTENDSSRTGTRMYAPPELLAGRPFTLQGDVYALGVLLYQMVVADLDRPLAQRWERDVPDELIRADVAVCTDGDPARRLASAAELAARIEALPERRREREAREEERRRLEAATRVAARRRRMLRLSGAVVGVSVCMVALAVWAAIRERGLRAVADGATNVAKSQTAAADRALQQSRVAEARAVASERRTKLKLADGTVAYGDYFASAGRWDEAVARYREGRAGYVELGTDTYTADVALSEAIVRSPPALARWRLPPLSQRGSGDRVVFRGSRRVVWTSQIDDGGRAFPRGDRHYDVTALRELDLITGALRTRYLPLRPSCDIAFSADARRMLAVERRPRANLMALVDVDAARVLTTWRGPATAGVQRVAFRPGGREVLAATDAHTLLRFAIDWESETPEVARLVDTLPARGRDGQLGRFNEPLFVSSSGIYAARHEAIWSLEPGWPVPDKPSAGDDWTSKPTGIAAFTADGSGIVWRAFRNMLVQDVRSGEIRQTIPLEPRLFGGGFAPDARPLLARGGGDDLVHVLDPASFQPRLTFTRAGRSEVARSVDSRFVATRSLAFPPAVDWVNVWAVEPSAEARRLDPATYGLWQIAAAAVSGDGRFVATAHDDGVLVLWDLATGRPIRRWRGKPEPPYLIFGGGRRLLAGYKGVAVLWDLWSEGDAPAGLELTMTGPTAKERAVRLAAFDSDLRHLDLLCAPVDPRGGAVEETRGWVWSRWDVQSGAQLAVDRLKYMDTPWFSICPPALRYGSVAMFDGMNAVELWMEDGGRMTHVRQIPTGFRTQMSLDHVGLSPDKSRVFVQKTEVVKVWDTASGKLIQTLDPGRRDVLWAEFVRGARYVLAIQGDRGLAHTGRGAMALWDVESGRELRRSEVGAKFEVWQWWDRYGQGLKLSDDATVMAYVNATGQVETRDVRRAQAMAELDARAAGGRARLREDASDARALAAVGEWLAFRGADDWSAEVLEEAAAGGAAVSHQALARVYWRLERFAEARREMTLARVAGEDDADYLRACVAGLIAPVSADPSQWQAPKAALRLVADAPKAPLVTDRFWFDAVASTGRAAGRWTWVRLDAEHWEERHDGGDPVTYQVVGRCEEPDVYGEIALRLPEKKLKVLLPPREDGWPIYQGQVGFDYWGEIGLIHPGSPAPRSATSAIPRNALWFDYPGSTYKPGRRTWVQIDAEEWEERYDDGEVAHFIDVGPSDAPNEPGRIVCRVSDGGIEVLVPPLKDGRTISWRRAGSKAWTPMARIHPGMPAPR